ncbi:MAG: hypothetical protein ACFFC7_25060 [Candidatus Hermodarchaeota archaeon]
MHKKTLYLIFSILILVVSAVQDFTILKYTMTLQISNLIIMAGELDATLLHNLIVNIFFQSVRLLSLGILFLLVRWILQTQISNKVKMNRDFAPLPTFVLLYTAGCIGCICSEIVGILVSGIAIDSASYMYLLYFSNPIIGILLAPLAPVLIVFFLLAQERLFSTQAPQGESTQGEGKNIPWRSFVQSPLFLATSITILSLTVLRLLNRSWYISYHPISSIASNIFPYLLLYLITNASLLQEKKVGLNHSLKDTIIVLWLAGMIGHVIAEVMVWVDYIVFFHMVIGVHPYYSTPVGFLSIGINILISPTITLILLVLFQMAYEKPFTKL